MSEHEQFKKICDKIGLDFKDKDVGSPLKHGEIYYRKGFFSYSNKSGVRFLDVREIIFTPEFMEKYIRYIQKEGIITYGTDNDYTQFLLDLNKNLDDPVQYLYKTLGL